MPHGDRYFFYLSLWVTVVPLGTAIGFFKIEGGSPSYTA